MSALVITGTVPALPLVTGSAIAATDLVEVSGDPHFAFNNGGIIVLVNLTSGVLVGITAAQTYQTINGTLAIS